MEKIKVQSVDEYIKIFPPDVQKILQQVRRVIKETAPDAEEAISYGMPGYKLNGSLVYFAAYKNHIGFYAIPTGHEKFKKELSAYKGGKGSVQFPLDKPVPFSLIEKIVKFRLKENLKKKERTEKGIAGN